MEALQLGVSPSSLARWVRKGLVRVTGVAGDRRYLLRDIVTCVAWEALLEQRGADADADADADEASAVQHAPPSRAAARAARAA
jgi:hypothetical protein